ncbi:HEAT repeat-containing protein 8 [Platysternon megacephalum]|uniref:HEAT repeat-containing protein 8 n=1 Tax=Platysternon megacephalum TaxID=55544 RepID=A0A4D9DVI8_9SAUR|nr:HEAT repeat-containing protein 8 [Platysternon megacephalum]
MPGEAPAAGIAAEAATACANCSTLQQNLNEYVAALIALKQKIIDTDCLLTEYQQKCNDILCFCITLNVLNTEHVNISFDR